jgi:GTPase SAR1 family protein
VYAIDDKESFEALESKHQRIIKNKIGEKPPIIVVGNKCDLTDERVVDVKEAEESAKSWGVHFLEVSAFEKINVKETFLIVAKELLRKKAILDDEDKEQKANKKRCYCF